MIEALQPSLMIDLIMFDPLEHLEKVNEFVSQIENLKVFQVLENAKNVANESIKSLISRIQIQLVIKVVKDRMAEISTISYCALSLKQSQQIKQMLSEFIKLVYKNNPEKTQDHLIIIKDLLMTCLNTLKYYFEQLAFVEGLSKETFEDRLFQNLKLIQCIQTFKDLLPQSNLIIISMENILEERILPNLQKCSIVSQIIFLKQLIAIIDPTFCQSELAQQVLNKIHNYFSKIMNQTTAQISYNSENIPRLVKQFEEKFLKNQ